PRLPAPPGGRELGMRGTVNSGEVLCKGRDVQPAQGAVGWDQKGEWPGGKAQRSLPAAVAPPAERHDLTHADAVTERGKPVVLPSGESSAQALPTGRRAEDGGKSERRPVTGRIGSAIVFHPKGCPLPPGRPSRENLGQ